MVLPTEPRPRRPGEENSWSESADRKHRPPVRVQTQTGTPSRDQTASGTMVLKVKEGLITEELGLDDGISVLEQLGVIAQS